MLLFLHKFNKFYDDDDDNDEFDHNCRHKNLTDCKPNKITEQINKFLIYH